MATYRFQFLVTRQYFTTVTVPDTEDPYEAQEAAEKIAQDRFRDADATEEEFIDGTIEFIVNEDTGEETYRY